MKPKWQHRNSDVRESAVEEMDNSDVLNEIAQHDEASAVRRAAVRKLQDLSLLENIAHHDTDENVREVASQRFKQVLCGQKEPALPLNDRLLWFSKVTDIELWEYVAVYGQEFELRLAALQKVEREGLLGVAVYGQEFELRLAALQKVEREGLLGDIVINDPISKVRLVALERVHQKSTLERIYKLTRNRDKRVSRIVREKLDKLIEQSERHHKLHHDAETICKQLEVLIPADPIALAKKNDHYGEREHTEIKRLQERWQVVEPEIEEALKERFTEAKQKFAEAFTHYQQERERLHQQEQTLMPIRSAKQRICEQTEQLLAEMQTMQLTLSHEKNRSLHELLHQLKQQWIETPTVTELPEEQQWQNRFEQLFQAAEKQYRTLQTYHEITAAFETWTRRVESLLNSPTIKVHPLKELEEKGLAVVQSARLSPLFSELNDRFNQLRQSLEERLQQQTQEHEQAVSRLKQIIKDLENSLETGELHTAISLEQQAQTLLQITAHGSSTQHKTLENRFQQCTARIRELRSWQRWGDNRERENLCLQMEALQQLKDNNPEEIVQFIREAQIAWKRLGSSGYSRTLWERFNKACNTAYEPCRAYFEAQGQERKENLAKREVLCVQLENFVHPIDWENPNWKTIHHFVRDIENQWRTIGPTDRKAKKSLQNRFNKTMNTVQSHLQQEQQRNLTERQQLIEQAKTFHSVENLNQAIDEVKQLQARWQVTVPGNRKEERRLWKQFRETCDKVFDRRKQQQDELEKTRQTNLDAKQAVCEQVESLVHVEGEAVKTLLVQLKTLQGQWKELGLIPKKEVGKLDKRFANACKQVELYYQSSIIAEQREQSARLKQRAALCTELEQLWYQQKTFLDQEIVQNRFVEIHRQWRELPLLSEVAVGKMMIQRFERVSQAIQQNLPFTEDTAGLKARETECIRLEILAGVDSPPEAQEARLAYQVARLSEAMTGGNMVSTDKFTEVQEIERNWYLTDFLATAEQVTYLESRFNKAIEMFYAKSQQTAVKSHKIDYTG